jgi:hypothetical protein
MTLAKVIWNHFVIKYDDKGNNIKSDHHYGQPFNKTFKWLFLTNKGTGAYMNSGSGNNLHDIFDINDNWV